MIEPDDPGGGENSASAFNTSVFTPNGRMGRRSIAATNPNINKSDTSAAAKNWVKDNMELVDGNTLPKAIIVERYFQWVEQSGNGGVTSPTLFKFVEECFPQLSTCPRAKGAPATFIGLRFKHDLVDPPAAPLPVTDFGPQLSKLRGSIPVLRRCPRGARMEVAKALTFTINEVNNNNTVGSWGNLFFFPYSVLPVPAKGDNVTNLTKWVKQRTQQWRLDPTAALPAHRPPLQQQFKPNRKAEANQAEVNMAKKVEAKLSDGDVRGAIRMVTSDDTIANHDESTLQALLEKHPPHPVPTHFPEAPQNMEEPPPVTKEEIARAVKTFPPGSAGGLDCLRPQILKDLISVKCDEIAKKLMEAMESLINLMLKGGVPQEFCPILFEEWMSLVQPADLPLAEFRVVQYIWEKPLVDQALKTLKILAVNEEDRARLLASSSEASGAWLQVLPSAPLGTHLSDESFRMACALRLGCDICQPHKCPCGVEVSAKGYHGLSCKKSQGRWSRHEAANDIINRALRSAGVPAQREPSGCSASDGKRPDGLTLIPWKRGKCLVWDFTCSDTFAPSYLPNTSAVAGAAAKAAEERKKNKYIFLSHRFMFVPVAMETSGVWGADGLRLIKSIGYRISKNTDEPRATTFLIQQLSLAVQRGNAAAILGTLPAGQELEELFLL